MRDVKNCYTKLSESLMLARVFSLFLVFPGEGLNPSMCKRLQLTGRGGRHVCEDMCLGWLWLYKGSFDMANYIKW